MLIVLFGAVEMFCIETYNLHKRWIYYRTVVLDHISFMLMCIIIRLKLLLCFSDIYYIRNKKSSVQWLKNHILQAGILLYWLKVRLHWLYIDACENSITNFTNNTSHLFTNTPSTHPPPRHVYPLPRLVLSLLPVAAFDLSEQRGHPQCVLSLTLNCSHQAPSLPR